MHLHIIYLAGSDSTVLLDYNTIKVVVYNKFISYYASNIKCIYNMYTVRLSQGCCKVVITISQPNVHVHVH